MREIRGNLWDWYSKPGTTVFITTNGMVRKDGAAVMGRGCALEAKQRFPGVEYLLGRLLKDGCPCDTCKELGFDLLPHNRIHSLHPLAEGVATFPVKHKWFEEADLALIQSSVEQMQKLLWFLDAAMPTFVLPRPGCGNGRLTWEQVRPLLEELHDNVLVITH